MTKSWLGKAEPRIVCAANLCGELIVIGPRHNDSTMHAQFEVLGDKWKDNQVIQGFIDQFGDFHTREEAWKIAKKNG